VVRVVGPKGAADHSGQLVEEGGGVLWRGPAAGPPGVYQIKRGEKVVYAVATATPAEESDLRALEPAVFEGRLAGGRAVHYRAAAAGQERHDDLWLWPAALCVACLLGELLALKLFRT
jgi:hypothetical protein